MTRPTPLPLRTDFGSSSRDARIATLVHGLHAYARARNMSEALALAKDDPGAVALLKRSANWMQRGAVVPHDMASTTTFVENVVDVAVDILGPTYAASAIFSLAGVKAAFLNSIASMWVPGVGADGAKPSWVKQGNPVRIGQWDSSKGCTLNAGMKLAYGTVVSNETLADSNSEGIFRQKLKEDVGAKLEADLLGNGAAVAGQNPAGLLNSVQNVAAEATLTGQAALIKDISGLSAAVGAIGGEIIFIGNIAEATRIRSWLPFFPNVFSSGAIAAGNLVAIAPRGIAVAGSVEGAIIDMASEATLWMDDAATDEQLSAVGPPVTYVAPIRSLYQSDCTAIRLILPDLTWGQRVAAGAGGAVAMLSGTIKW